MSGPSTLVRCRRCGWERPYEWFLEPWMSAVTVVDTEFPPLTRRVKECRACRDQWDARVLDGEGPIVDLGRAGFFRETPE